jgi:hypothetical protein
MEVRGISQYGRILELVFSFHGGPKEMQQFLVTFEEATIFHLPGILHRAPVRFRVASPKHAETLVPRISYDPSEFHPKGYAAVELTDASGNAHGYYVVAQAVTGKWESQNAV